MRWDILINLLDNAILLLALSVGYEITYLMAPINRRIQQVFNGLLIALICMAVMNMGFELQSGVIFDTRTVIISVSALVFGPIPTAITVAVAVLFRMSVGGVGMMPGILIIFTSAFIGFAWRTWLYPKSRKWSWLSIYAMSLAVNLAFLAAMLLLPYGEGVAVVRQIALPVLVMYPIITVLLSLLLMRQQALKSVQDQLKQSEQKFQILFDQAPLGYQALDADAHLIEVNQQWLDMLGYSREEVIGKWFGDFVCPEYRDAFTKRFPVFKRRGYMQSELEMLTASQERLFIAFEGKIGYGPNGEFQQTHVVLKDITETKLAEAELSESERSKSVLLSNLPGMAYRRDYDCKWGTHFLSQGCHDLTGYSASSLIDNEDLSYSDLIAPECISRLQQECDRLHAKKMPFRYDHEYEIITATGERKWVLETGQVIYSEDGEREALEGIVLDISDRKQNETELRYMNEHDSWTGLYNRDYLEMTLAKDAGKCDLSKKALISVNLNTVQILTANYGFNYTQALIKTAADELSTYCTDKRLLFQTYGNRFVFYIKGYNDKSDLIDFSEDLANTLESLFVTDKINGGIGILEIGEEGTADADLLLRRLLIASETSMNVFEKDFRFCFYDQKMEDAVSREGEIRQELSRIAESDDIGGDLFLLYQPIMDLSTDRICGFEALSRLKTEKLGLISPVEFIPIAEKTKLIIPLGEKIILNAFSFLNKLKNHGYHMISIAINVSAIQLLRPDFTDRLFEMIDQTGAECANIVIEITESTFSSDYKKINTIIKRIKDVGIHVAIDDFGTGHSSLARERELGVDCLKIDKYFIDRLRETNLDTAITSDIISIGHKLGHCVIAEGVEHESQLQYLRDSGCDKVQGHLISEPLNEEVALQLLAKREIKDCRLSDS